MTRVYHIHAGAHRTGTSSFQLCLHVNKGVLKSAGYDVAYPGRDGIPSGRLSLQLPSPRHGWKKQGMFAERVKRSVAEHASGPHVPLVFSEENIPGRMLHFFAGKFYPAAEARIAALADGLELDNGGRVGTLLFVVRDYAGLYRSAWRRRAEDNLQPPFEEQAPNLSAMDRGWPELVALLQEGLRPERMLVLDYGKRGTSAEMLWRLLPGVIGFVEPSRHLNVSVTEAALEALQNRFRAGEELSDAARKSIISECAEDKTPRGLTQFSTAQSDALAQRYAEDLERLRTMSDLQLIS